MMDYTYHQLKNNNNKETLTHGAVVAEAKKVTPSLILKINESQLRQLEIEVLSSDLKDMAIDLGHMAHSYSRPLG